MHNETELVTNRKRGQRTLSSLPVLWLKSLDQLMAWDGCEYFDTPFEYGASWLSQRPLRRGFEMLPARRDVLSLNGIACPRFESNTGEPDE